MAVNLESEYPGRTNVDPVLSPNGTFKNETTAGAGDGVPFEEKAFSDLWGFLQHALEQENITASGTPDNVKSSQYYDALRFRFEGVRWGTVAQTVAGDADFYTDGAGNPLDASNDPYPLNTAKAVLTVHDAIQSNDLRIIGDDLLITNFKNHKLEFISDANEYSLEILGNNCRVSLNLVNPLLIDPSRVNDNGRIIKSKGVNNIISWNGTKIYNGAINTRNITPKASFSSNPYHLACDGTHGYLKVDFLDLIANGHDRSSTDPTWPNLATEFGVPDFRGRVLQMAGEDDGDRHARTNMNNVTFSILGQVEIAGQITGVSDVDAAKLWIGARAEQATYMPNHISGNDSSTTSGTAFVSKVVNLGVDNNTIYFTDFDTQSDAVFLLSGAGIAITISNSGATALSKQADQMQSHWHMVKAPTISLGVAGQDTGVSSSLIINDGDQAIAKDFLDSGSGVPRVGTQTRHQTAGIMYYIGV